MKNLITLSAIIILFLANSILAAGIHIGPSQTYTNIQDAANVARPGDTIYVHAGSYSAYQFIPSLHGTSLKWIVIKRYQDDVMDISGSWQFSMCSYIKFEYLTFKGNTVNTGRLFHIDNGGSCETQSHHIIVDSCYFLNVTDPTNSAFKFGGVDSFEIKNCVFKNIAAGAFDYNVCHVGKISGNLIENCQTGGHIKGGSTFITMERNLFLNASVSSWVAFELGGDTGAQFYCPGSTTEVSDLKFYSNIIIGGYRGLALSSAVNCTVANNTFYECGQATMRFLTTSNLYPKLFGNIVRNNIFAFGAVSQYMNGGTQPSGAVTFKNNIYYSTVSSTFNGPYWDGELDSIKDPNPMNYGSSTSMFVDGQSNDFHLIDGSPAIASGYSITEPAIDYYGNVYKTQRSIGAVEYNSSPSDVFSVNHEDFVFNVFPNPASNYITVGTQQYSSQLKLQSDKFTIYNSLGIVVITNNMTSCNLIGIKNLPDGIYFIKIGNQVKSFVKK